MNAAFVPVTLTPGCDKGGQNPDNTSGIRPAPPQGSCNVELAREILRNSPARIIPIPLEDEAERLRSVLLRMKPCIMRQGQLWELLKEALGTEAY